MHKIEINPDLLQRLRDDIDPSRTAHMIIDLQNGFMETGAPEGPFRRAKVGPVL